MMKSHPHGCVSWNLIVRSSSTLMRWSHPHGCVSWNPFCFHKLTMLHRHTLTGVWVEIAVITKWTLSEKWSHPHGCVSWNRSQNEALSEISVTPSRVCELKYDSAIIAHYVPVTPSRVCELKFWLQHSKTNIRRHTLTGVWVEIILWAEFNKHISVTPSRVCELKFSIWFHLPKHISVTPSRVCELKCCWDVL